MNKWEKIGFLNNLPSNKKKKCSELYDNTIKYLFEKDYGPKISTLMIPLVYWLIDDLSLKECDKININYLCDDVNKKYKEFFSRKTP